MLTLPTFSLHRMPPLLWISAVFLYSDLKPLSVFLAPQLYETTRCRRIRLFSTRNVRKGLLRGKHLHTMSVTPIRDAATPCRGTSVPPTVGPKGEPALPQQTVALLKSARHL